MHLNDGLVESMGRSLYELGFDEGSGPRWMVWGLWSREVGGLRCCWTCTWCWSDVAEPSIGKAEESESDCSPQGWENSWEQMAPCISQASKPATWCYRDCRERCTAWSSTDTQPGIGRRGRAEVVGSPRSGRSWGGCSSVLQATQQTHVRACVSAVVPDLTPVSLRKHSCRLLPISPVSCSISCGCPWAAGKQEPAFWAA